jgi:hypothetical protein
MSPKISRSSSLRRCTGGGICAAIIYLPLLQKLLSTAALPPHLILITAPFPFIVWGADEVRRYLLRRHRASG